MKRLSNIFHIESVPEILEVALFQLFSEWESKKEYGGLVWTMGAGISSRDVSNPCTPFPDEALEQVFSFLSVDELLMAASVCTSWRIEAYRAISNQTHMIYLDVPGGVLAMEWRSGRLLKATPSTDLILSLAGLQKKHWVWVTISDSWLKIVCSQNKLLPKWVERRRLAKALCSLQSVYIDTLTPGMAGALFSALATCRTGLKYLGLPNGWTGSLRPGLVARGLRRVQELYIGELDPANTTVLLQAVSEDVGQLKSLVLGHRVSIPVGIEIETVAKALNQVEELRLVTLGHTGFRDHLCLKATLRRLATPGESNLKCLRLVNLDNSLTKNTDPDLWISAVSALGFFSLQVNMSNMNNEGGAEDSFGIEVQDIMDILVTVTGERMDKIVRNDYGEKRKFHIHPFGICPENCAESD